MAPRHMPIALPASTAHVLAKNPGAAGAARAGGGVGQMGKGSTKERGVTLDVDVSVGVEGGDYDSDDDDGDDNGGDTSDLGFMEEGIFFQGSKTREERKEEKIQDS